MVLDIDHPGHGTGADDRVPGEVLRDALPRAPSRAGPRRGHGCGSRRGRLFAPRRSTRSGPRPSSDGRLAPEGRVQDRSRPANPSVARRPNRLGEPQGTDRIPAEPTRTTRNAARAHDDRRHRDDASAAARGGIDPHHARGRGRVLEPGDALFDRQGFVGHAASGDEGVLSRQAAVPAAPYRHDLEVPGDDRLSRRGGEARRHGPHRPYQPGGREGRHHALHPRLVRLYRHHEDRGAEGGADAVRLRRGLRRRPPRRGEEPGQGADLLLPHRRAMAGTPRTSGPSSGTSTTPGSARASRSGSSRCRTGPSSISGSTS